MHSTTRGLFLTCVCLCACGDNAADKARQRAAAAKQPRPSVPAEPPPPPPQAAVNQDPFWGNTTNVPLSPSGKCPEGLWALVPGLTPGATPAEKKANEAQRKALAAALKGKTFVVTLRAPEYTRLLPYDAPHGTSPVEVQGSIDCRDATGSITLAWTKATARPSPPSALQEGAEVTQDQWVAEPIRIPLPQPSLMDGHAFEQKNQFALTTRVVIRLESGENHRKLKSVSRVEDKGIRIGGGQEDWGAGRLVRASVLGVRLATQGESVVLHEKRN